MLEERILVEKLALLNAIKYGGKANPKSIIGSAIKANPDFKKKIKELQQMIQEIVEKVNAMSLDAQKKRLMEIDPTALEEQQQKKEEKKELPPLPEADKYDKIVLRLAPYPSGPLHIGNSRMVVLNDYYAKRYKGELYLVFDDTIGSETKLIDPEAYDMIPEGLEYLGVKWHKTYYKSDRLDIFYKYARDTLEKGETYVCTCDGKEWREQYKMKKKACPCRNLSVEENLERWEKMLDGTYPEKGAVVRLKTDMAHPDPALRDPVMLRISEKEHPRVGSKYRVWPLLEFSWGIDDHEFGISHIIRGKDLRKEGIIENMIWDIYGWKKPQILLYGRMRIKDLSLSKSKSAEKVRTGEYQGWSDPRTWSLQSLKRRGIKPEAIRQALLDIGLSAVDVTFSPQQIYSVNRALIDPIANRFFMVHEPIELKIIGAPDDIKEAHPPIHPDYPERGTRTIPLFRENADLYINIQKKDAEKLKGQIIRLKDLMNIELIEYSNNKGIAKYHSKTIDDARKHNARIIQWVPRKGAIPVRILMVDGTYEDGIAEPDIQKVKVEDLVQFERFAFCKVEKVGDIIDLIWTHR